MNGRILVCTRCRTSVLVFELPGPFIDPDLYVGIVCRPFHGEEPREPDEQGAQLTLMTGALEETREYDPMIAAIPF